ncbi:3-mercaptopyruvate sulfurtransferase-like [Pelobates cultripes]|uniref:3-mercaptopyruvate sulfurtransferase-like n=1 Tax=Pelobates cultripes TaxID=61616 RepID=A0AAD1T0R9_PELCU|nr:3-mercaptopyruvate sulfurtransferase-like [Pelobates cultripes]
MTHQLISRALVSPRWLFDSLRPGSALSGSLRVLDASWHLPKSGRDGWREYKERHIPGSYFFDIDACSDRTSPYDHMLPSEEKFSEYAGHLGISNNNHVVVYDASDFGSYSAPRLWWMFRVFGHPQVSVLDGGLKAWMKEGYPLKSGKEPRPKPVEFQAKLNASQVVGHEEMVENMEKKTFQLVDARVNGRFRGLEPEPREGIEPGHIPGAVNLPFPSLLNVYGYKSTDEMKHLFQEKGIDLSSPLVASCGSGVTACHIALAAYLCGKEDTAIYDGSWVEWYMRAKPEDVVSEGRGKTL